MSGCLDLSDRLPLAPLTWAADCPTIWARVPLRPSCPDGPAAGTRGPVSISSVSHPALTSRFPVWSRRCGLHDLWLALPGSATPGGAWRGQDQPGVVGGDHRWLHRPWVTRGGQTPPSLLSGDHPVATHLNPLHDRRLPTR